MKLYSIELDSLPEHIQEALWSDDFFQFRYNLHLRYPITEEQDTALDTVLGDLFAKRISVEGLTGAIKERLNCDMGLASTLARLTMLNAVLVFPEHFGDKWQYYKAEFKGTEEDLNESRMYFYLLSQMEENFKKGIEKLRTFDYEKEAMQIKKIFQTQLVGYLRLTDSMPLIALNALIFAVIRRKETFPVELQQIMLDNQEEIGIEPIIRDGAKYPPRILEWIRDLLASSGKEGISSLSIAKYITQNPNVRKLSDENKEAVHRLFEAYYTLKNFPDSLTKIPPADWVIVPYTHEEAESVSPARLARASAVTITPQEPSVTVAEQIISIEQPTPEPDIVAPVAPPVAQAQKVEPAVPLHPTPIVQEVEPIKEENDVVLKPLPTFMPTQDYDKRADEIIVACGFTIAPEISSRLKTVIATRLRNVRNDTQTKLRLMDPTKEGGIGLSSEDAEKVLTQIKLKLAPPSSLASAPVVLMPEEEKKEEITAVKQEAEIPASETSLVEQQPAKTEITSSEPHLKVQNPESKVASLPTPPALSIKEDEDGVPTIVETLDVKQEQPSVEQQPTKTKTPVGEQSPKSESSMSKAAPPFAMQGKDVKKIPIQVRPGSTVGKVPVSDVKAPPRLLDAVGELRAMTIKDFRRLSPNPVEAAGKIMTKIQLLEKDSYTKKMAGIEAWKENEVSQLYRDIGKESFGAGANMNDVIEKRKNEGKPFLTTEEFEALLDLNEQLRT